MILTKENIFASQDITTQLIPMPEWGGEVRIKAMSIGDQIEFEKLNKKSKDTSNIVCNTLMFCCIDEDGERLFSEEDLKLLEHKSFRAIEKLFKACLELNALSEESLEKEAKNS